MLAVDPDVQRAVVLRAIRGNLLRLKWHGAALRFELALRRHDRALKYNPEQPRIPEGNPGGGRWTDGLMQLAGEVPTNDPPEVPKERPKTSPERSAAARTVARILGPAATVVEVAKFGAWLVPYASGITSYNDPPAHWRSFSRQFPRRSRAMMSITSWNGPRPWKIISR